QPRRGQKEVPPRERSKSVAYGCWLRSVVKANNRPVFKNPIVEAQTRKNRGASTECFPKSGLPPAVLVYLELCFGVSKFNRAAPVKACFFLFLHLIIKITPLLIE